MRRSRPRRACRRLHRARATSLDRLLTLQRAAGNRAVATVVARSPRAKPKPKPKPAPKGPQGLAERRISHIVLSGLAPIEVVSWSWQGGAIGGPAGAEGSVRELQITTRTGDHSSTLMSAITEGREFAQAELVVYGPQGGGFRVMLSRVMVTSYQNAPGASGEAPLENLGLSAQDVKVSMEPSAP